MSALTTALTLRRLREDSAAWSLLGASNAAVAVAVLAEHLGADERRLASSELFERVEADLVELRVHGFELPRTGQAYCAEWRGDGILIRRPSEESRGETYELSPDALSAIRYLTQLAEPRQSVTESRLALIAGQLHTLAVDTDPDVERRLQQLRDERDAIDARIEAITRGDVDVLGDDKAIERARDILAMAEELPGDFAKVRAEIERINRALRERIVDSDETQSHVLDEIFRGVDLLAASDAGRSFAGFYALVLDPELSAAFEDDIERVLARTFAGRLTPVQRKTLRRLLSMLQEQSSEVHGVMTTFARGLRRFVQSQEFQQDRVIKRMLREALAEALHAAQIVKPWDEIGVELALSSVELRSIGALSPHNPADLETAIDVVEHEVGTVDLDDLRELARETEIDLAELTRNVNAALETQPSATIAEVLAAHPATQGVASVIGLLVLADRHAVDGGEPEDVEWAPADLQTATPSTRRRARIARHTFTERIHL
ncbi:DUF3375 domain-containing protein [Microbacteriaceae bacterium VKM Ac-2855]|nr:DUF3375 domain-containing protein [Microbacteriaceae bacterium VKM Ac-2855]